MLPEITPLRQLEDTLEGLMSSAYPAARVRCFHCDSGVGGADEPLGGLRRAKQVLSTDKKRGQPCSAILMFGLQEPEAFAKRIPDGKTGLRRLWDWPGLAYLSYGFGIEELVDTARLASEGAGSSLPEDPSPSAGEVLRLTSEVRHWLENRRRNVEGAQRDFESAARGEIVLDESYLSPVSAISDAHREMLDRLWAMEASALRYAPRIDGLAGIRAVLDVFEARWRDLELARAAYRQAEVRSSASHLTAAVDAHRNVVVVLAEAIRLTHELDDEMTSNREA